MRKTTASSAGVPKIIADVGAKFAEVPVVLRYDLKQGQSKMHVLQTAARTVKLALQRRLEW
ncbi:MAG: hypothetical protein DMG59_01635 [Acidobacteria bacterium]|nr:MAG: hypothetical protein DMG59_01635 [Acidobacteriota bacterium]